MSNISDVADILSAQSNLNESVSHALQALALTTDRYDDALSHVAFRLSELEARLQTAEAFARDANLYGINTREMLLEHVEEGDERRDNFSRKVPS